MISAEERYSKHQVTVHGLKMAYNAKLPQVYGTQWIGNKGEIRLYQVEDMEKVDQRRAEGGLCSIAEYKESLKEAYDLSDEDFQ